MRPRHPYDWWYDSYYDSYYPPRYYPPYAPWWYDQYAAIDQQMINYGYMSDVYQNAVINQLRRY